MTTEKQNDLPPTSDPALASASGSEILDCPHCHKTTEDKDRYTDTRAVMATTYTETNASVVQCNWCGLSGPIFDSIPEAIAAWNGLPRKSPNNQAEARGTERAQ